MRYFQTIFLEEAELFISGLEQKTIKKILKSINESNLSIKLISQNNSNL